MFFAAPAPTVDPEKRSLNASPPPLLPLVEAADAERWTPNVEGVDLPEPFASRGVEEPPVVVDDEEESRAKRSGLPYVELGFGGGVEVEVVVGRGVEASVGGFEGVVDAQRSAKESLIVSWLLGIGNVGVTKGWVWYQFKVGRDLLGSSQFFVQKSSAIRTTTKPL